MDNLSYEERLVAYVDILGFRNLIKESESNLSQVSTIYTALNLLKKQERSDKWNMQLFEIEESAQKKGVKNFDISDRINCTCFSDTIVVSVKLDADNVNEMVSTLICNLSAIGALLITEGVLIRGGITIGKLIHNDDGVIMGQGLIDAYELESRVARYPRIVLSDKLLSKMNYPIGTKRDAYPYHQYLERFSDGCVGFHQLVYFTVVEPWIEMSHEKLKLELKQAKLTIIGGLDKSFEQPEVHAKYVWLKEQYNKLLIFVEGVKGDILEPAVHNPNNFHYSYIESYYDRYRPTSIEKSEVKKDKANQSAES